MQNLLKNNQKLKKTSTKHKKTIARLEGDPNSFKKASQTKTMELEMLQKQRNLVT